MRSIILFRFLFFSFCIFHQSIKSQTIQITSLGQEILFEIDTANKVIKDAKSNVVLYSIKGNLTFAGISEKKRDIIFLLNGTDIFSRKGGYLVLNAKKETYMSFTKGRFYLGESVLNKDMYIGEFEKQNNGTIVFKFGEDSTVLFQTSSKMSAPYLVSVLAHLMAQHEIDKNLLGIENSSGPDFTESKGTIRKLWDNKQTTFMWDGIVLKSKWTYNDFEQWTFDGTIIQRKWYDTGDEWIWDGTKLQSRWNSGSNVFVKEGNTLRALYGNAHEEYLIQGNIIKRAWTQDENEEWEVNGEIPIPLMMMIVFKIIR